MDFTLTESQRACVESAGAFADLALKPHAARWDREHEFPIPTIKQAAALGLCGLYTPEQYDGLGLSRLDASLIFERLAMGCTSTTAYLTIHNMVSWMLGSWLPPEVAEEWVPRLAGGELLLQPQQLGGRLGHVDIQGIQLLDGGQVGGLLGGDQSPFGDAGFADAAGDGGRDAGIAEVDLGALQGRLGGGDLGDRLLPAGLGIIVVLGADGLGFHQLGVTLGLEACTLLGGLSLGQRGVGAGNGGFIGCWINLIQRLTGFHITAFGKVTFQDNATHLRTNFRNAIGAGAAWQFGGYL